MKNENMQEIKPGLWKYKGFFIEELDTPIHKFEVYKDNEIQSYVGRYITFSDARKDCDKNQTI